jgi:hypothetical protein
MFHRFATGTAVGGNIRDGFTAGITLAPPVQLSHDQWLVGNFGSGATLTAKAMLPSKRHQWF